MPGLVPGIHVFAIQSDHKSWMAIDKPGHDKRGYSGLGLRRGWGDVWTPLVGVVVMAGVVMRGIA
jgi:hypothetical protein